MPGTGAAGYKNAQLMAAATGEALHIANSHVLVCSTGIIGTQLPMDPILSHVPHLARKLSPDGGHDAARGILTTDHQTKEVVIKRLNLHPRRHGQGVRHDRTEHGDDAGLPNHRC